MIASIKLSQENTNFLNNSASSIKINETTTLALSLFKQKNATDEYLENKVMFLQRHIRAKLRKNSEIQRISQLGLNPEEVFKEANKPYRPQECNTELANRIMEAAEKITLYTTIKHLTAIENIDQILDGCLYGRENLIRLNIPFRPSALSPGDVVLGDGNVICFGPNLIDPLCLQSRTMGMEFELKKIVDSKNFNRNPCIFFKQKDLMYNPYGMFGIKIKIKHEIFEFGLESHFLGNQIQLNTYVNENFHSSEEIVSCKLISYNLTEMQKILVLNFFRFLDCLPSKNLNFKIYALIAELNNEELSIFLTEIGKIMSAACEFNFYGAHKIDLDALLYIHLYDDIRRSTSKLGRQGDVSIEIKCLLEELNNGSFESFNKIKNLAPELLKSNRFMQFLLSKISDPQLASQLMVISKNILISQKKYYFLAQ